MTQILACVSTIHQPTIQRSISVMLQVQSIAAGSVVAQISLVGGGAEEELAQLSSNPPKSLAGAPLLNVAATVRMPLRISQTVFIH